MLEQDLTGVLNSYRRQGAGHQHSNGRGNSQRSTPRGRLKQRTDPDSDIAAGCGRTGGHYRGPGSDCEAGLHLCDADQPAATSPSSTTSSCATTSSSTTAAAKQRPPEEYREPTSSEWTEFDNRKVELGSCGRPYGTPCAHEHACIRRCPMLTLNPEMLPRLDELEADLVQRRDHATANGWKGAIEGIDLTHPYLPARKTQPDPQSGQPRNACLPTRDR